MDILCNCVLTVSVCVLVSLPVSHVCVCVDVSSVLVTVSVSCVFE